MEEAEVCCQKIGIMARGIMRCIGTTSRLKYLYGKGYNLEITFEEKNDNRATTFVNSILPAGYQLTDDMSHIKKFKFSPSGEQLAEIFQQLLKHSRKHGIHTWGINQTTLDEIFASLLTEKDM